MDEFLSHLAAQAGVVDSPTNLLTSLIGGVVVGLVVYGTEIGVRRPTFVALRLFMATASLQILNFVVLALSTGQPQANLSALLWVPRWALFALAVAAGMVLRHGGKEKAP